MYRKTYNGLWGLVLFILMMAVMIPVGLADSPGAETLTEIQQSNIPPRDPVDLAVRLKGLNPATFNIAPRPAYQLGDVETFYVSGREGISGQYVDFVLAGVLPGQVYMWMQRGLDYNQADVQALATRIGSQIFPAMRTLFGVEGDVEGDPHIYILNVGSAGSGVAGLFNDTDMYPNEIFMGSNEIDSLMMAQSTRSEDAYIRVIAHEFQHMVQANLDGDETWLTEGLAETGTYLATPQQFDAAYQTLYLEEYTGNQLNAWPEASAESPIPYYGASSLFLIYLAEQYSPDIIGLIAREPADGIPGIEKALTVYDSGLTFNDVFADFVIANLLNTGGGRYGYPHLPSSVHASASPAGAYPIMLNSQVKQYGTRYFEIPAAQTVTITFSGQETVKIIPAAAYSGEHFYWSQRVDEGDARLTGHFDLRNVSTATFKFHTWYDIGSLWDYGYLSISTDNGATWQLLTTSAMTDENPYERAFATGLTGNSQGMVSDFNVAPAPYVGVQFNDSNMSITEVRAGTPAEAAGIQVGDRLIAMNGENLNGVNFVDVIDRYQPGEEVRVSLLRDGDLVAVTLTLAASPYRSHSRLTGWIGQSVDLTPYVGHEVLIRFDYVTDQALTLPGWAIDDVSIPEIGFFDDMESDNSVWNAEGWVRINNVLSQAYLLQLVSGDTVERLLEPGEGVTGTWMVDLKGQRAVLALSGIAPITTVEAPFVLEVTN